MINSNEGRNSSFASLVAKRVEKQEWNFQKAQLLSGQRKSLMSIKKEFCSLSNSKAYWRIPVVSPFLSFYVSQKEVFKGI